MNGVWIPSQEMTVPLLALLQITAGNAATLGVIHNIAQTWIFGFVLWTEIFALQKGQASVLITTRKAFFQLCRYCIWNSLFEVGNGWGPILAKWTIWAIFSFTFPAVPSVLCSWFGLWVSTGTDWRNNRDSFSESLDKSLVHKCQYWSHEKRKQPLFPPVWRRSWSGKKSKSLTISGMIQQ